jgi:peptidoglycan/LPS O-acetylase OafA/YrhL
LSAPLLWISLQTAVGAAGSRICGYSLFTLACLMLPAPRAAAGPGALLGRLGDASYSIYLTHPLLLSALALVFGRIGRGDAAGLIEVVIMLLAALFAGLACYRFLERPLLSVARRWLRIGGRRGSRLRGSTAALSR